MTKLSVLFLFVLLSVSAQAQSFLPEYTILHYGNGFGSLDQYIQSDLNQMEIIGSTRKIQVVAQFGSYSAGTAKRYHIQKDADLFNVTSPVVKDLGLIDMGDWKELTKFVLWGMKNFPAKRYFVIVGGHGDGWRQRTEAPRMANPFRAISPDENTRNAITTTQLGMAFETVRRQTGKQIDIFGADACLMGSIEVAAELSQGVKFMVASQELEPAEGWVYNDLLVRLNRESDMSPRHISRLSAQSYMEGYRRLSSSYYRKMNLTISTADLGAVVRFSGKLARLAEILRTSIKGEDILELGAKSGGFNDMGYADLGYFLNNLLHPSVPLNNQSKALIKDLINDYETNVIIRDHSSMSRDFSTGLHIWIPMNVYDARMFVVPYSQMLFNKISHWGSLFTTI